MFEKKYIETIAYKVILIDKINNFCSESEPEKRLGVEVRVTGN